MNHLQRAVEIARRSAVEGGGPFGAVIVLPDGQIVEATNRVTLDNDPTAHAEVSAIRKAAGQWGFDLSGSVLYTSCQPCPMCLTASLWARLDRIVYAATEHDASAAGFDDRVFYEQLTGGLSTVTMSEVIADPLPERNAPFEAWAEYDLRVEY